MNVSERLQSLMMKSFELGKKQKHGIVDSIHLLKVIFEDDVLDGLFKRIALDKQEALMIIDEEMTRIAQSYNEKLTYSQ